MQSPLRAEAAGQLKSVQQVQVGPFKRPEPDMGPHERWVHVWPGANTVATWAEVTHGARETQVHEYM